MKKVLFCLLLLVIARPALGAVVYINGTEGTEYSGNTTTTVVSSAFNVTAGNHIVVGVRWFTGSSGDPTITDLAGNTYTQVPTCSPIDRTSGTMWLSLFYAENVIGHATNVLTATWGVGVDFKSLVAIQRSGVGGYDTCANNGTGTTPTCTTGMFTTSQADTEIVTFAQQDTGVQTWSAGGSATLRQVDSINLLGSQTQVVSSIQTNATATMTSNGTGDECSMIVAVFRVRSARRSLIWGIR